MKNLDLSTLNTKQLVLVHNAIAETGKEVKGFKSGEVAISTVTTLLEESTKGKANKARLQTGISKLPLVILAVLSPAISFAKDLSVKIYPAHRLLLAKMLELGMDQAPAHKDTLAEAVGIKPDNAKFADVLGKIYSFNLITWDEQGNIGLLDTAINFVNTNSAEFDLATPFDDLAAEAIKAERAPSTGGGVRSRLPKDGIIVPLFTTNPCSPGKGRHADYERFIGAPGMTVEAYTKAGGIMFNLIDAIKRVRVRIDPGASGVAAPAIEPYEKWR